MRLVLDASLTLCWLYHDEQDSCADTILELLLGEAEAVVPSIWWYEIRNSALLGVRKMRINDADTRVFFGRLRRLPIAVDPLPDDQSVFNLARRHRLTFYDAAYLELAQREGLALATLDTALAAAAKAEGIALVGA